MHVHINGHTYKGTHPEGCGGRQSCPDMFTFVLHLVPGFHLSCDHDRQFVPKVDSLRKYSYILESSQFVFVTFPLLT